MDRAPTLAPPAGGFKWKDDEYWNKHEGLMTQTWPHLYESREKIKNKPMTINSRSFSGSGLGTLTLKPTDPRAQRPQTVPTNMPSQGRRFLDNLDEYMGRSESKAENNAGNPGRMHSHGHAERRALSSGEIGHRRGPRAERHEERRFKENASHYQGGLGRAEPLNLREQDRAAYGLTPFVALQAKKHHTASSKHLRKPAPEMAVKGCASPLGARALFTDSAQYGSTAKQASPPPTDHIDKGKVRTASNVVMGM